MYTHQVQPKETQLKMFTFSTRIWFRNLCETFSDIINENVHLYIATNSQHFIEIFSEHVNGIYPKSLI